MTRGTAQDAGAAEMVGVIMLISILVVVIGVIAVVLFSQPPPEKPPAARLNLTNDDHLIMLYHAGGDSLPLSQTQFLVDGIPQTFTEEPGRVDTQWTLGETLQYRAPAAGPVPERVDVVYNGSRWRGTAGVVIATFFVGSGTAVTPEISLIPITASAGAGGTISPSGTVQVASNSQPVFIISNNPGYAIADVKVDGVSMGAIPSYTFPPVAESHTITATFTTTTIPLTAIGPISGTPQVSTALTAGSVTPSGATVTYQWYRSPTLSGTFTAIAGATSDSYILGSGDAGYYLNVTATGTGNYYGTVTNSPIGPVRIVPVIQIFTTSGTSTVPSGALSVDYCIVGGGGGGGSYGGGGGAGGFRTGTISGSFASSYPVTVGTGGAGGIGGLFSDPMGKTGTASTFFSNSSARGGGGGSVLSSRNGLTGGSGGGGIHGGGKGGSGNTPSVSPSQGNNGGDGSTNGGNGYGGGGGGAGTTGGSADKSIAGNGGAGSVCSINGVIYAGGGGGGAYSVGSPGSGGSGGGGDGGAGTAAGTNGSANTGGGGGGGGGWWLLVTLGSDGGDGGSGIVILKYY